MSEHDGQPRFSIVIPTYQRREVVRATVLALTGQRGAPPFEVIVVVDGSDDGSADALRALSTPFALRVVEQPNLGASAARNAGAAAARADVLLFLDDDMEAGPDLLAEHDRSLRAGADAVLGHLALHPDSPPNALTRELAAWEHERLARLTAPGAELTLHDLLTGQISVRRGVFEAVGSFDTNFTRDGSFGGEDLDFGYRLLRDGHKVVFNPAAVSAQRYVVEPDAAYFLRWRQAGRSDAQLSRKHPERAADIRALAPGQGKRVQLERLARVPLLGAAATRTLRAIAVRMVSADHDNRICGWFLNATRVLEYQRGVADVGGLTPAGSVVVLCYHAIADLGDDPVLATYAVPPARFTAQLDGLARRGHRFVDLDAVLAGLAGTAPLPERGILLTFDDAYVDLREAAALLAARGIPAVTFAVSDHVGATNAWDRPHGAGVLELLDAGALLALSGERVEVGAHTRTHPQLTALASAQLADEVGGSRDALAAAGLPAPRAFAYPYGMHDERAVAAARDGGYAAAFTLEPRAVRAGDDPHRLPRLEVRRGDTPLRLALMIAAASAGPLVRRAAMAVGLVRRG